MQCLQPINIPNPKFGKVAGEMKRLLVPCGRCYACLSRKRQDWALRLNYELRRSSSAKFITLTYDDQFLPVDDQGRPCFDKSHIQKFFKSLRHYSVNKLKYYLVSEYGGQFGRPHYHLILYNFDDSELLESCLTQYWPYGFHQVGTVTPESINYVSGYFLTKSENLNPENPPFTMSSKGLGSSYIEDLKDWHNSGDNRFFSPVAGYRQSLPRYYKERIFSVGTRRRYADDCAKKALLRADSIDPIKDNEVRAFYRSKMKKLISKHGL